MYDNVAKWMDCSGPMSDIVISSRVRLARNIAGYLFLSRSDKDMQRELLSLMKTSVEDSSIGGDLKFLDMNEISQQERDILSERYLVSRRLAEARDISGVAIAADESLAIMMNEEDHLRLQVMSSGLQLRDAYSRIEKVEKSLEEKMEYSFSERYGYLTACPTNAGTGIRVSVMLHLPALKMAGQIEKVLRASGDMNLAVRGVFGEGSEPVGDLYQISNQTTLGKSEYQIIEELTKQAIEPVVEYERRARQRMLEDRSDILDDKIFRAYGTMSNARMISSEETLFLLSYIRLGVHLGRFDNISLHTINELFLLTQPAHLQNVCGEMMDPASRDIARASLIRSKLS